MKFGRGLLRLRRMLFKVDIQPSSQSGKTDSVLTLRAVPILEEDEGGSLSTNSVYLVYSEQPLRPLLPISGEHEGLAELLLRSPPENIIQKFYPQARSCEVHLTPHSSLSITAEVPQASWRPTMSSNIITPKRFSTASTKVRYATYSLILTYSVLVCAWGIMDAVWNGTSGVKLIGMGSVVAAFAVFVFAWAIVLHRFNNVPQSEHKLSRIKTHVLSLAIISCIMIVITIPLFTQIPNQCDASRYSGGNMGRAFYCTWISVTILYSWICALFAFMMAFFIRRQAIRSNYNMNTTNIALIVEETPTLRTAPDTREDSSKDNA